MSILSPAFAPSYPEVDRNCKKKTRDFVPIATAYFSSSSFSAREVTLMSREPVFIAKFSAIKSPCHRLRPDPQPVHLTLQVVGPRGHVLSFQQVLFNDVAFLFKLNL